MDDQAELRAAVRAFLAAHTTMTLATCGEGGPWAASLFYAEDGFILYFVSNPATRHGRHAARDPNVAATISADDQDWRAIKGIQIEGVCRRLEAEDGVRARQVYLAKYPFAAAFLDRPASVGAAVAQRVQSVVFYAVEPRRLLFTDNARAFGDRREVDLSAG